MSTRPVRHFSIVKPYGLSALIRKRLDRYVNRYNHRLADHFAITSKGSVAIFAHDYIGVDINQYGLFEGEELSNMIQYLKPIAAELSRGIALDVGANIGNHTRFFSEHFSKVYSFEPNPDVFHLLRFNTRGIENVEVFNTGLGDSAGSFSLNIHTGNLGGSSISRLTDRNSAKATKILVEKLDDLEISMDALCFIKIDVEGYELNVLEGGIKTIRDRQPLIVFEQHEEDFVGGVSPCISLLASVGYRFCWERRATNIGDVKLPKFILKLLELFVGKRVDLVSHEIVPPKFYSMLIAVPPRFQGILLS